MHGDSENLAGSPPIRSSDSERPEIGGVSDDVLRRILVRMDERDPADAPELAGAISAILASRLEGTPIPDEVRATVAALDPGVEPAESSP